MVLGIFEEDGSPPNELGEPIARQFDPQYSPLHRRVPEQDLIVYTPSRKILQLRIMRLGIPGMLIDKVRIDHPTVVVCIAGACQAPRARASWAVFFGPQSPHNASGRLPPDGPQTRTRAEMEALLQALPVIRGLVSRDTSLWQVRVVSDSAFLVKALSESIQSWTENNGYNARGRPVSHYETLKDMHEAIGDLEHGNFGELDFRFWHVSRERNKEANELAGETLVQG